MPQTRMFGDGPGAVEFVRRGGVWVPRLKVRDPLWRVLLEWAAMTALACAIVGLGGLAGLYRALPELDRESRVFASQSMQAIAAGWSRQALADRAEPGLGSDLPGAYARELSRLKALGPDARVEDCRGRTVFSPWAVGDVVSAHYLCTVAGRRAQTSVAMWLKDDADAWRIAGFYAEPAKPRSR